MNSNNFQKHVKRKVMNSSFAMGQKIGTASNQQSSCSIFRVDEDDVKFVVDNSDDSKFPTTVPADNNIELPHKTYPKKNSVSYPMISHQPSNTESFDFSVLSPIKPMTSETLKSLPKSNSQVKRKLNGKLETSVPEKVLKKDIGGKSRSSSNSSFSKTFKGTRCKTKPVYPIPTYTISSDSEVEMVEEVIFNTNALNAKSKIISSNKHTHNQNFSSTTTKKLNISEIQNKKYETKSQQNASKSCFIADNELIMNEADTAPYMPNNPTLFPDVHYVSSPLSKWLDKNEDSNDSFSSEDHFNEKKISVKNSNTPMLLQKTKQNNVDKSVHSSRELKSLYENLNEISWTHKNSFRKLLRNTDNLRHSDRGAGRNCKAESLRNNPKKGFSKISKASTMKKSPTIQAGLKKTKLAKATTNKKLAKLKTNNKLANKLARQKVRKLIKPAIKKLPQIKIKEEIPKIMKQNEVSLKPKPLLKNKVKNNLEKLNKTKNKKSETSLNEKSKNRCKKESPKVKVDITKIKNDEKEKINSSPKAKAQLLPKPKIEVSEASSSGMQEAFCDDSPNYNAAMYNKDTNLKKFIEQQEAFSSKHFGVVRGFKKDDRMFTPLKKGSQCHVPMDPLEQANLWNPEYFDDFRKQFLQQALRKAMEKREPNCITAMLHELCDSYMMPAADDGKSKKKKPEEETLRSSVRQLECAFRYKEIVVRKLQNYMQVILVPSYSKKNCLSIDAMKELRDAFVMAKKDIKCKAVLINSGGSFFCTGIDLSQLIGSNKKQACEEMASVIRELVLVLASFSKPVIAAVNGDAYGFGVSLLTYCDVVLASDKATFCIPSTSIGYMPEGGITLTLPAVLGNLRSSDMLLQGSRITAAQAQEKGLVTDVFWPTNLMHEVIPRIKSIIAQPLQVMEATKLLVRANLWDKLKTHMDFERRLIVNQWLSVNCQENIKRLLRGDSLLD